MSATVHSVTITPDDVEAAAKRIEPLVRRTPTITIEGSQLGVPGTVSLKLEHLQHSGSFKARGATSFLLANEISPAGVVAASGGNHGAAVAWAASQLGHRATIFVPTISAPTKVDRLLSYGADVRQEGAVYAGALQASVEHQAATGATAIHAYEDPAVMAGAGTIGREMEDQVAPMDAVLVACGGGGLGGGIATWLGSRTQVVACETEGTNAYAQARAAGHPVDVRVSGVAADALGASQIGDLAWQQLSAAGATSAVVTDDDVVAARTLLWEQFRLVVEPSAAVPLAALVTGRHQPGASDHTGVVICGANTKLILD